MPFTALAEKIKSWPKKPGVYLMINKYSRIIYIGKAKNLQNRIQSYFKDSKHQSLKTQFLLNHIQNLDYILTDNEAEALLLEAVLVKKHKPRYNVRLKDDKAHPYIRLSKKDPFPRFYLERKVKKDGSIYFGPYLGGGSANHIIRFLNENFKIRDCSDGFMKSRKKPCLTYHTGHCPAPCVKPAVKKTYLKGVNSALSFLKKGRGAEELGSLKKQMKALAEKQHFEQALILKNRLLSLQQIWQKQTVANIKHSRGMDVFSYYTQNTSLVFEMLFIRAGRMTGHLSHFEKEAPWQNKKKEREEIMLGFLIQYYMENLIPPHVLLPEGFSAVNTAKLKTALRRIKGESSMVSQPKTKTEKLLSEMALKNAKNKLKTFMEKSLSLDSGLLEIKKALHLPRPPQRIEGYDISHFQSAFPYASQVVFENGEKKKSDYRLYRLKPKNDDYQAMREVLSRRFAHPEYEKPDLLLIDGGKGQLSSAVQIVNSLKIGDVNIASVAKAKSKSDKEKFFIPGRKNPILIPENKKAFQILIQTRDEAHRFALTHHRKKLTTHLSKSLLDGIKGVGEKTKIKLFKEFKSIEGIEKAGQKQIIKKIGLSPAKALLIIETIKQQQVQSLGQEL